MASDYLLELDGIKGESQDKAHPGAINIDAFSWGVSNAGAGAVGGGAGAGKAVFQDFHFTKPTDTTSPTLFLACASGQRIKKATLFVRKAQKAEDFYTIRMSDVLVSSFQSSGAGGEPPTDNLSFVFAGIQLSVATVNADGVAGTPVTAGWDLIANKKA